MPQYKVRESFFNAAGLPFHQGQTVDAQTFNDQTSTDQGHFDAIAAVEEPATQAPAVSSLPEGTLPPIAARAAALASTNPNHAPQEVSASELPPMTEQSPSSEVTDTTTLEAAVAPLTPTYPPNAPVTHEQLAAAHETFFQRLEERVETAMKNFEEKIASKFESIVHAIEHFLEPPNVSMSKDDVQTTQPSEADQQQTTDSVI